MKRALPSFLSFVFFVSGYCQVKDLDSLKMMVGQTITFCGQVVDSYVSKTDSVTTFLNFGGSYPNVKLTAVIFKKDAPKFHEMPNTYYLGQHVCITGDLVLYKERPEIILNRPEQIWIEK